MKRIPTYRQRLAIALNSAPRITLHSPALIQAQRIEQIRAKAAAHAARNPSPRAVYLLG